ncbi:MAG: hypothetical protein K2Y22_05450 [Candidatus Obscuribacterales bacterium]|nr:hypothetical protein [Candidatus Obscuribacterales bacterium]
MEKSRQGLEIEKEAAQRLYDLLKEIPFLDVEIPVLERWQGDTGSEVDGKIDIWHGKTKRTIVIEIKQNAQMRDARAAVEQLKNFQRQSISNIHPVLVAPYLNNSIRQYCRDQGVGYFDFSGSCRLVFDDVFIEKEMPGTEFREKKRLRSLFSQKASHVIRRLIEEPIRRWRVEQLAEFAVVSAATVSLLKKKLIGEEYAAQDGEFFYVTKPEKLLREWSKYYHSREHVQIDCFSHLDLDELEEHFAVTCANNQIEYAFTMFSGARRISPYTRGVNRAYAYISTDKELSKLPEIFGMAPVDSGGNFRLIKPNDADVFFGKRQIGDATVVSDIQLYLDLAGHPGRGEENAEYLLEQVIRPKW